jgi:coatomer subunit zeta
MSTAGVFVNAVLVLDATTGSRIHAKYFSSEFAGAPEKQVSFIWSLISTNSRSELTRVLKKLAFEKKLHAKSLTSTDVDVLMLEGSLAVYVMGTDIYMYVVGNTSENEIMLMLVLEAFLGTLKTVLRGHLDKHTILDNLELLLLTVDEIVDAGTVLETDSTVLAKRVMLRNSDGSSAAPVSITNPSELTLTSAFNIAREGFARFTRS